MASARGVKRVVIVDDSRTVRSVLGSAFERAEGFKVVGLASDAEMARDLIARLAPDLVMIDFCMPYIDGAALLKLIGGSRVPKIVVSDSLAKSVLMQARLQALGASACFALRDATDAPDAFFEKVHAVCDHAQATHLAGLRIARPVTPGEAPAEPIPAFPIPRDEAARIAILRRKQLSNATAERQFDLITRYVGEILRFPVCLLTFIDRDTQWLKSTYGMEETQMRREDAFCSYTIAQDGPLVVTDAADDRRFEQSPLVVGEPNLRTYVGHPITLRDSTRIGALCVLDTKPRYIGQPITTTLTFMADIVAEMVEARPSIG
ncbi:response regulator [Sphingomonas sp. S1-29]|uniref:response regulator n=1 Tax=Sphingomonas sp. S1-29 TaxID=2991074 RepID=UPI00223F3F03|nr:response regulator [Sphingomonas sp. S1-29]UZK70196.1 response regulator [Sphingomonas sp. S1-29]